MLYCKIQKYKYQVAQNYDRCSVNKLLRLVKLPYRLISFPNGLIFCVCMCVRVCSSWVRLGSWVWGVWRGVTTQIFSIIIAYKENENFDNSVSAWMEQKIWAGKLCKLQWLESLSPCKTFENSESYSNWPLFQITRFLHDMSAFIFKIGFLYFPVSSVPSGHAQFTV